jgi:hypothetical protein
VDPAGPFFHDPLARVVVVGAPTLRDFSACLSGDLAAHVNGGVPSVLLALGVGSAAGRVAGRCFSSSGVVEDLSVLKVIAEGLPHVDFSSSEAARLSDTEASIWSRTIGALGEGVWRYLTDLRSCLVGCGRSGSLMAASLRRFGVKHLTLIDPDYWEMHNLGESDVVTVSEIGTGKASSLASGLIHLRNGADVSAIQKSVLSLPALIAAKESDVLICAADNPTAHLATAVLANLYLKPLLDIGTGVLAAQNEERRTGADIRLILPGRCLMCFGGIAGFEQARRNIFGQGIVHIPPASAWRSGRAGSLRSLNMIAVGHALRLLEELAVGRIRESTWLNLEFQACGLPVLAVRAPAPLTGCRMCQFTASGDPGLTELPKMLTG